VQFTFADFLRLLKDFLEAEESILVLDANHEFDQDLQQQLERQQLIEAGTYDPFQDHLQNTLDMYEQMLVG